MFHCTFPGNADAKETYSINLKVRLSQPMTIEDKASYVLCQINVLAI